MKDRNSRPSASIDDELPVRPHLRCRDDRDLGFEMGAAAASSEAVLMCRNAILLSLHEAMTTGCSRIHSSRNRNTYSRDRAKLPPYWTHRNVTRAIIELTEPVPILLEHRALPQSPRAMAFQPKQSSLSAGPAFRVDAELDATLAAQSTPGERIRLRNRRKKEKALPSNAPIVDVTDAFLERYDKALKQARLEIRHPSIKPVSETVSYALVATGKIRIDLGRRYPVRIFSGDMNSGGRWYHTFWTEIPSAHREAVHIDGAPVFEHDFSACHLRLAYYAAGAAEALAAFGERDLYALDGFDGRWRSAIKAGVNIMLNARSLNGARGALSRELDPALVELRPNAVDEILSGIKAAHPAVERFWHSDCGVGLQFVDSEIMRLAIERLLDRGVLALCVHDSLMAATHHRDVLVEVMEQTFATDGQRMALERFAARRRHAKRTGHGVRDLTNGRSKPRVGTAQDTGAALGSPWSGIGPDTRSAAVSAERLAQLSDLATLIRARRVWSAGIIRAAIHTLATAPGDRASLRGSFQSWQLSVAAPAPAPPDLVHAEFKRFYAGSRRRPTEADLVRMCGIELDEAEKLKLAVLRPRPRGPHREAQAKRAKRMAQGVLPTIIQVKSVKPWLDTCESRTKWYARTTEVEHQVLALQSIVRSGNPAAVARAAASIAKAQEDRRYAGKSHLPVDDLLAKLEVVMERYRYLLEAESRSFETARLFLPNFDISAIEVSTSVKVRAEVQMLRYMHHCLLVRIPRA